MKKNTDIWLTTILALFVLFSVLIALLLGPDTDTHDTDTNADSSTESRYDSTDSDTDTTETESGSSASDGTDSADSSDETKDTDETVPDSDTNADSRPVDIDSLPDYDKDSLGISGGYTPDQSLTDALANAIAVFDRPVSFLAVDLKSGISLSYNVGDKYSAASMVKASFAYYVCHEIDAGNASLNEKLTYTAADTVYADNVIGKAGIGKEYTLYQVLYYTIVSSDNEGYYMLLRRFGRDGYDAMMSSIGCPTLSVSGTRWPDTSAIDMVKLWQKIYTYNDETANGKMLYELFEQVEYMNFIERALGVPVANKAGWNSSIFNDCGVVSGENSTYILAIFSKGNYFTAVKSQFYDIIRAVDALMNDSASK